ncbi:helix-turn-helix domain-containing protein [Arthrobacter sp. RAF14]|uniref:helix-turn-helix domain-containing protein n=1 Tax=Arthrobacter sp. RAF14 TaxID=3233051 RepID=UPI003F92FE67
MLQVTSSIADFGVEFTAPELERETGLSPSSVHRLLSTLCSVGLLSRLSRKAGVRIQTYRRVRHPFWKAMLLLTESARGAEDALAVREGSAP